MFKFKKETLTQVFCCEFCETFKKTFLYRTPLVVASQTNVIITVITCYKLILFRFLTYPWAKKETLYLLFCSLIDFARHVLNKYEMLLFTISSQPYNKINVNFKRKKQSFAYVLQNRCSRKF